MDDIIFSHYEETSKQILFYFKNKDYVVRLDLITWDISCTCFHGSNMGINNKQVCKHKKFILNNFQDIYKRDKLINKK